MSSLIAAFCMQQMASCGLQMDGGECIISNGRTISERIFETWNLDPSFNTVDLPFCSLDFMYSKMMLRFFQGAMLSTYLV